jgi:predicted RNA-binding protein associated with RNAse of E/G family
VGVHVLEVGWSAVHHDSASDTDVWTHTKDTLKMLQFAFNGKNYKIDAQEEGDKIHFEINER